MSGEWWRTEAALARVLPAKLVTALLAEPRGWSATIRWVRGARPSGEAFTHHRDVVIILRVIVAMTVLEGAVVDLILRVVLGPSPWVWIALGLHLYAVFMIVAVHAGMVTRPHSLDGGVLRLRTGLGTEVAVPVVAIGDAQPGRYPAFDRSGWKVDGDGDATLARGEANFRLTLIPDATIRLDGRIRPAPTTIHLTVDEPRRLAAAVDEARDGAPSGPQNGTVRA